MSKSTNIMVASSSWKTKRSEWSSLVIPWVGIVAVACVGAALSVATFDSGNEDPFHRSILEASSRAPPIYIEEHPPLFPITKSDIYGFSLAVLGLMVAAGGGIGGGGILVPIYILIFGFSPKHAIPLSNITVFGGAIANTYLNAKKRHPLADRPLVDWDLILVMEPLTIAGALLGAFLNKVLPELLLTVLLVLLLSFTANNTLRKATKMYKAETRALRSSTKQGGSELTRMAAKEENGELEAADTLVDNMEKPDCDEEGEEAAVDEDPPVVINEELEMIIEDEKLVPTTNLKILITLFVVVLAINLLKGGGAFKSPVGIRCGSLSFWVANGAMLIWILTISIYVRNLLVRKYQAKERCGFQYVDGDIKWDAKATILYPVICCLAGFVAGMFGVGGGIVKGPLMLQMGVHPAVSSASSACMILFTSFTATTSFIVFGLLVPDYAVVCLVTGFVATLIGQIGLSYIMKKAQRNSYIAFSIGVVVLLSAFLMTIQSVLSMATGEQHHAGGICGKGD